MSHIAHGSARSFRFMKAALLSAVSVLAVSSLHAQEAETGATRLGQITVSGQAEKGDGPVGGYVAKQSRAGTKTDVPVAKTPQSIAVVSREQIEDQAAQSVAEALRYTPGVMTDYRGSSNLRDEMFVRGFYYVPRYLDGLFLGGDTSYEQLDPYLLERVELVSGPASVLYGQANPGGIVNMVSKKPTDEPLREVQLTAGTNRRVSLGFDYSDRVAGSDALSWRVAANGLRSDLQEDFTKKRSFAIAPSVRWTPDAQTSLTIMGGYQNEPDAGFRNFMEAAGTVTPITGFGYISRDFFVSDPGYERFDRRQAWIGYEFERDLTDNITFRQNARYSRIDMTHHTLVWGSLGTNPSTGLNTLISRRASGGTDKWHQFSLDNQLQAEFSTGDIQHTLLGGIDYRYRSRDYMWGGASVSSIDVANPQYGNYDWSSVVLTPSSLDSLKAKQAGIYLQDQAEIDALNLMAGLRYDWAGTDIDDRLTSNNDQSYDDHALTWRVGALYAFDNGISPYVSYSTSFEPSLYSPPAGVAAFDPTTSGQFEAGVKYAPEGSNTLLTAAFYDLRQNDVVQGAWNSTLGRTVYSQIGKIHNRGIELSARTEFSDNLSAIASYSYIDSKITETVTASELGKTPARVPQHQASLWGTWSFDGALDGLTLGAGVRYIGTSQGNNANTFQVAAATLFDAMISYDFGAVSEDMKGLSLQVNAKNLADKTYVASCASAYACFYGEGRSVMATLKKTW